MSFEDFRRHGHQLIDWIADHLATMEDRPIAPDVEPGAIRAKLPEAAPQQPEDFGEVLADLDRVVVPGTLGWQHPGFMGLFPANVSLPAILGELASAGLGQVGMMWSTGPAVTEIENHVLDWLVDEMGLPSHWRTDSGEGGGVIQSTASEASHTAMVVARERAVAQGVRSDDLVAYGSAEAHSSIEKGAKVAGYRHIRLVDTDDEYAMRPDELRRLVALDVAAGRTPAIVTSTVGTTGTTAVDPVRAVAAIAREHGLWHHVDAAYAGSAMLCEEFRHHVDGVELVDSYVFNPHKWLLTNFDCSVFWVADRRPLIATLSITPPYLRNPASESGQVIDYRDWHVPLGRRFRSLKLWWVLRSYGVEGLRATLRAHVALARGLAERLEDDERFELVAPVTFSLVAFAHRDGDEATDRVAAHINASGDSYVTPSSLPDGRRFVRVAIGQPHTGQRHVDRVWQLVAEAG